MGIGGGYKNGDTTSLSTYFQLNEYWQVYLLYFRRINFRKKVSI